MEDSLKNKYYDSSSPGSFGGVERLHKSTGVNREKIKKWLEGEDSYTLHKQQRTKFPRRCTIVSGIKVQYQIDLMDMQNVQKQNNGYKYILLCIDVFTKMAYAKPIKNKTSKCVIEALKAILKQAGKCRQIQSDKGKEFINKAFQAFLRKEKIKHFTSQNEDIKCAIAERLIRTLRQRLGRFFTHSNSYRYIGVLQKIMSAYNNTVHRSIKIKPIDVNKQNEREVWLTLYGHIKPPKRRPKFNIGDQVRIAKGKQLFKKSDAPSWSEEIFTLSQILKTSPYTYKIKDYNGEELIGSFYDFEIQKVVGKQVYKIEKIIKERKVPGIEPEVLVRWQGYSKDFDSWIPRSDIEHFNKNA